MQYFFTERDIMQDEWKKNCYDARQNTKHKRVKGFKKETFSNPYNVIDERNPTARQPPGSRTSKSLSA